MSIFHFLKNLFFPSDRPRREAEFTTAWPARGTCTVPDGHQVTMYRPTPIPSVQRTPGGAFIANLGHASDELLEEMQQVKDKLHKTIRETESPGYLLVGEKCGISDLFAPNDVNVFQYSGLVIWILDASAAHLWLHEPEEIIQAVKSTAEAFPNSEKLNQIVLQFVEPHPTKLPVDDQSLIEGDPPYGALELHGILSEAGIQVGLVPNDGDFMVEVIRPDCAIGALRTTALPEPPSLARPGDSTPTHYVMRAPRLRRLTLAARNSSGDTEASRAFFIELLRRKTALLVLCSQDGRVFQRQWGPDLQGLPIFPDLSSLLRASKEMGIELESLAWIHLLPADLFTWAKESSFGGVALNAYTDEDKPVYFMITRNQFDDLAAGRMPQVFN